MRNDEEIAEFGKKWKNNHKTCITYKIQLPLLKLLKFQGISFLQQGKLNISDDAGSRIRPFE